MIKDALNSVIEKKNLDKDTAYAVMKDIMSGQTTTSQIAGLLVALRFKGETEDEIAGFALAMRDAAQPLAVSSTRIVDSCGTGGDGKGGINISTAASFVVAGAGFTVAKHGNRSISSRCGSADVLELMGVRVDPPIALVEQEINQAGIGFLFAPHFHPAMKYAMPTRKELGIRTIFNILGPLTNPAHARVQLIGVYQKEMVPKIAKVLAKMDHAAGLVVHSNGWDEITLDAPTIAAEMSGGKVKMHKWTHNDFGLPKVSSSVLKGGDAQANANALLELLEGKPSKIKPVVLANAGALIMIATKAYDKKTTSLKDAVKRAEQSLSSGQAHAKFKEMAAISHAGD